MIPLMANSLITKPRALALLVALICMAGLMHFAWHAAAPAPAERLVPHSAASVALESAAVPIPSIAPLLPGATVLETEPSLATLTWNKDFKSLVDRARVSADSDFRAGVLYAAGMCSIVLSGETIGPDHFQATHGALLGADAYQRWNLARARIQGFCASAGHEAFPGLSPEQRATWKRGAIAQELSTAQRDGRIDEQRVMLARALADPGKHPHALRGWVLGANRYFNGHTAPAFDFAERSEIATLLMARLNGGRNPESLWPELQCAAFGHCLSLLPTVGMPDERLAHIDAAAAELHRRLIEQRWNELLPPELLTAPASR